MDIFDFVGKIVIFLIVVFCIAFLTYNIIFADLTNFELGVTLALNIIVYLAASIKNTLDWYIYTRGK